MITVSRPAVAALVLLTASFALADTLTVALPSAVGVLESERSPISVHYQREDQRGLASAALAAADEAWQAQVEVMGFPASTTVDDDGQPIEGLRLYLVEDDSMAGHSKCVASLEQTPETDCAAITLLSDAMPEWYLPMLVTHELNHALQMAVDCTESPFAYEQITVAVTEILKPGEPFFLDALTAFQGSPHSALYSVTWGSYYHYGAGLFSLFLDRTYGRGDGELLARIWAATAQPGPVLFSQGYQYTTVPNEPDLLDAMTAVLAEEGVDFDDAFARFSVARYFIGGNDDGAHLSGAARWVGAEPLVDARFGLDQLPLHDLEPASAPEPLGVGYLALETAGAGPGEQLQISFSGALDTRWRVMALAISAAGTEELPMELDESQRGAVTMAEIDTLERVVMVAVNLGDESRDSDQLELLGRPYAFTVERVECPALEVGEATPRELTPGDTAVVTVSGAGFTEQQEIAVEVSGEGVAVAEVERLSPTELRLTLDVASDAAPGPRALRVVLDCGAQTESPDLVEVMPLGCGCAATGDMAGASAPLLLLLGLALRRRARR